MAEVIPSDALASSAWVGMEAAQLEMVIVNMELQHATCEEHHANEERKQEYERKHGGHKLLCLLRYRACSACDVVNATANGPRMEGRKPENDEMGCRGERGKRKMPVLARL